MRLPIYSWKKTLQDLHLRFKTPPTYGHHAHHGQPRGRTTAIEPLQDRQMLTASAAFTSGALSVTCGTGDEVVITSVSAGGIDWVRLNNNEVGTGGTMFADVNSITVTGGDGDDNITIGGGPSCGAVESITIDAGEGNNVVDLTNVGQEDYNGLYSGITITAGDGNNVIHGGGEGFFGNGLEEQITTGDGNNTIYTPDAYYSVWVTAGDGDNEIHGGNGYQWLQAGDGDNVFVPAWRNSITSGSGTNQFVVDPANGFYGYLDTINVYADPDAASNTLDLSAMADDFTLDLGSTEQQDIAGDGNTPGPVLLTLSDPDAITGVVTGSGCATVTGNARDNTFTAGSGGGTFDGGDGNDTFLSGAGDDTFIGGTGDDNFIFDPANGDSGNLGTDTITEDATVDNDTLDFSAFTTSVAVDLSSTANPQTVHSGTLALHLSSATGIENVLGSATAANTITGNSRDNNLTGGDSGNTIVGNDGDDTITGGSGTDTLQGNAGSDVIYADDGNDTVYGGTGDDKLYGEDGNDTLTDYDHSGSTTEGGDDTFDGGAGTDTLTSYSGDDTLIGGDGNDTLTAGDGNDTLQGDAGDDALTGGAGDDQYIFDPGASDDGTLGSDTVTEDANVNNDTLDFSRFFDDEPVNIDLSDNTTTQTVTDDVLSLHLSSTTGIEDVLGGDGEDTITGNSRDNYIVGASGDDELTGNDGDDRLTGGDGGDTLDGNNGADLLIGGDGDDTLTGGAGNDTLVGEAGENSLDGGDDNDTLNPGPDGDPADPDPGFDLTDGVVDGRPPLVNYDLTVTSSTHVLSAGGNTLTIDLGDESLPRTATVEFVISAPDPDVDQEVSFTAIDFPSEASLEDNGDGTATITLELDAANDAGNVLVLQVQLTDDSEFALSTNEFFFVDLSDSKGGTEDGVDGDPAMEEWAPVARPDAYWVPSDGHLETEAVTDNDVAFLPTTATLISGPSHWSSFQFNGDGTFDYVAEDNWSGVDSFTYQLNDGLNESNIAKVDLYTADLGIKRLQFNDFGSLLTKTEKHTTGAMVRLNNDDDNKDGVADNAANSHTVVGENDLMPILIRPMQNAPPGGKYTLLFDGHLRVWRTPDRTGEVANNTDFSQDAETWLYVEGNAAGAGAIRLAWSDGVMETEEEVTVTVIQVDLDIDSDNNNGAGAPDGSDWEETLEDNPYGLGRLIMVNSPTRDDTWMVLRLWPGLNPNDPNIRVKFNWNPDAVSGEISLWTRPKVPGRNGAEVDSGGDRVYPGWDYSLSGLRYDPVSGEINLWAEGVHENPNIKTLAGVERFHPDDFVKATLKLNGVVMGIDEVKYIVTTENSFVYHLQTRQEVRAMLASRGIYKKRQDLPDFSLRLLDPDELKDKDHVPNPIGNLLGPNGGAIVPGLEAGVYQDYITGQDQYVLTFAGNDDSIWENEWNDWYNDIDQARGRYAPQYEKAMEIADSLGKNPNFTGHLVAAGHSLGGGLASAAAVVADIHADTFNAAGLYINTLYKRDPVTKELVTDLFGNYIEIYQGSVERYGNAARLDLLGHHHNIDAYYLDYDLLHTVQWVINRPAIGYQIEEDGPFDSVIGLDAAVGILAGLSGQEWVEVGLSLNTLATMVQAHSANSMLYGLLVQEHIGLINSFNWDVLGYDTYKHKF